MTKTAGEYAYIIFCIGMDGQPKAKNQHNIPKQIWRDVKFETKSSKSPWNHIFREEQKLPVLGLISLSADRDEAIAAGTAESPGISGRQCESREILIFSQSFTIFSS